MMDMFPVTSSNLHSVGFENGTLYIRFKTGRLYAYFGVPEHIYFALMNASSKGSFFARYIKNNYRYRKLS